jgi:hypothetical protein
MAYQLGQSSMVPSRPAPPAPGRRTADISVYNGTGSSLVTASTTTLASQNSYSSGYTAGPPSPSMSQYHSTYSGIGGSPNRNGQSALNLGQDVIRNGWAQVKDDGFAGFLNTWSKKFLVLREQTLSIQKNEVCHPGPATRIRLLNPHP